VSAPFVAGLRSRPGTIELHGGVDAITLRVELAERWDVVRIAATPAETVLAVKVGALSALEPGADHRQYVLKLRGAALTNETETLLEAGARDGSIFLLEHRRRRPVR
jgi:hypothetical protein